MWPFTLFHYKEDFEIFLILATKNTELYTKM